MEIVCLKNNNFYLTHECLRSLLVSIILEYIFFLFRWETELLYENVIENNNKKSPSNIGRIHGIFFCLSILTQLFHIHVAAFVWNAADAAGTTAFAI